MVRDPLWRRFPLSDRLLEVIDSRPTGETLLDEALKLMKSQEHARMSVNSWIDLLSGMCVTSSSFHLSSSPMARLSILPKASTVSFVCYHFVLTAYAMDRVIDILANR